MSNQSQLSTFSFESNSIRTLAIDNEPWFVAKDLCDTLGIKNPTQALENLDEDERSMFNIGRSKVHGGGGEVNIVSESGMYTLILRCRDAVKKGSVPHRFRKWVTAEVLPAIRKTGKYEVAQTTAEDRTGLRDAVNFLVSKRGLLYSDAYNLVHQRFNVKSIEDLTLEQLPQAVEYIHKIALEGELIAPPRDTSQMVKIPHAGRWLVITREDDENRTVVKNIDGKSCVDVRLNRKLMSETHLMADMLLELAHRMRIVDGECNPNIFDTPILQSKRKTII
nr:MAG TPA: repressor domain protein [Caudoviricetes sp.]